MYFLYVSIYRPGQVNSQFSLCQKFRIFGNLYHFQMWNFFKNKNAGPPKWPIMQFLTSYKITKIWFMQNLSVINCINWKFGNSNNFKFGIFSKIAGLHLLKLPNLISHKVKNANQPALDCILIWCKEL